MNVGETVLNFTILKNYTVLSTPFPNSRIKKVKKYVLDYWERNYLQKGIY